MLEERIGISREIRGDELSSPPLPDRLSSPPSLWRRREESWITAALKPDTRVTQRWGQVTGQEGWKCPAEGREVNPRELREPWLQRETKTQVPRLFQDVSERRGEGERSLKTSTELILTWIIAVKDWAHKEIKKSCWLCQHTLFIVIHAHSLTICTRWPGCARAMRDFNKCGSE